MPRQLIRPMFALATLLALSVVACTDTVAPVPEPTTINHDRIMERLAALGYRTDMVIDHGDQVLVEGDILLSKADLLIGGPRFQWVTDSLVETNNGRYEVPITVDLSGVDASAPEWATALRQGMAEWSNLQGSSVLFVESGSPANITAQTYHSNSFDTCGGGNGTVACAAFPTSSTASGTLNINLDFAFSLSPSSRMYNMVHELGHKLGFRHSNWQARGETSVNANQVSQTPQTDAASVMNGGTALNSWIGFSGYDKVAARWKFTGVGPTPVGSVSGGSPTVSWPGRTDAVGYIVWRQEWIWGTCTIPFLKRTYVGWCDVKARLGTTTSTSWTDFARTATSTTAVCDETGYYALAPDQVVGYYVQEVYPGGTGGGTIAAFGGVTTCLLTRQ